MIVSFTAEEWVEHGERQKAALEEARRVGFEQGCSHIRGRVKVLIHGGADIQEIYNSVHHPELRKVFGAWPSNETDDEVSKALAAVE